MKKLILISALLLVASNGWAQVSDEIHQRCKDVADYVGCVQISTGSVPTKDNSSEADLKKALKLLPRRLENTSLRDFSSAIQPFTDALALAETDDSIGDSQLVRDSRKIDNALSVARSAWDTSIEASVEMSSSMPMLTTLGRTNSCSVLNREVEAFNASLEGHTMNYPCSSKKTSFNRVIRNENEMISIIRQAALVIADGKALDYPPFISVEDHYAEEISRDLEREKKYKGVKKLNGFAVTRNMRRVNKILKNVSRSVDDWFEAKKLLEELIYSPHSNVKQEYYFKIGYKWSLATLLLASQKVGEIIPEERVERAIELLNEIIEADINNCDVCSTKALANNFNLFQSNSRLVLSNIKAGSIERYNKTQEELALQIE